MVNIKKLVVGAACGLFGVLAMSSSHAALLGVKQAYPDVTLSANTLIYDNNAINSTTGLLRIVSLGSTLSRASGSSTPTQLYTGAKAGASTDVVADVMLTFAIDNKTGALVTNLPTTGSVNGISYSSLNKVSIGLGNAATLKATNFGFSWQGAISALGSLTDGTAFDAKWRMTQDQYQAMPSGYTQFKNGYLTGLPGGLIITNTVKLASNWWTLDWIRGQFACVSGSTCSSGSAYAAQIAPYVTAATFQNANRANSTVLADVFVPLPAAAWLMLSGIFAFLPWRRSRLEQA